MAVCNPGNANLPIGGGQSRTHEHAQTTAENAIQENGGPSAPIWHSRGYLPHFESSQAIQHVTFHLADSLPQETLRALDQELRFLPAEERHAERRKRIDAWIDAGHGSCILGKPEVAAMVQATLLFFDAQRYRLLAWVVMPNHVHALLQTANGWTVASVVASWKKFTARKIRDYIPERSGLRGALWHREYWDRYIRNQQHLQRAISYIHLNPVRAGLAAKTESWPWSSAFPGNVSPGNANLPIGDFRRKP